MYCLVVRIVCIAFRLSRLPPRNPSQSHLLHSRCLRPCVLCRDCHPDESPYQDDLRIYLDKILYLTITLLMTRPYNMS